MVWHNMLPASHGQLAGSGAGSHNSSGSASAAAPLATSTVVRNLSGPALTSVFQPACNSAASRTMVSTDAGIG